jgi:hypothetical protein
MPVFNETLYYSRNRVSSVDIATGYGLDGWSFFDSQQKKIFFSSS